LNDFDLTLSVTPVTMELTSNKRTGTKPFMVIDLLKTLLPPHHLYCHNLESFFYVFIFLTCRYHEGTEVKDPPFQSWLTRGDYDLAGKKALFITSSEKINLTDKFTTLDLILIGMRHAFHYSQYASATNIEELELANCHGTKGPAPFDEETLGGYVSFEKFQDIFIQALPVD
jgi:hypothetical protein